ncbi:ABC transporter ATP-binding protein [Actinomycetaceae bacterium L2_0104]
MTIELVDLEHTYPTGDCAVAGVSLTFQGTQPVAIIGQNGAGKTTLVKHFNGILHPSRGRVAVDGVAIEERQTAQWAKTVGYVFQNPDDQLFSESVQAEFVFGPRQIGMGKREIGERLDYVAELVGLRDKLDTHPYDLTSTQKKFCTIGAVLMMDPKVIIFDEPTCGQDVAGNRRLERIVAELQAAGKLCITISHDMKFVTANFARTIVMSRGNVLIDGPTRDVFAHPEILKESFVSPPPITRVAQAAGVRGTPFTVEELIHGIQHERNRIHG